VEKIIMSERIVANKPIEFGDDGFMADSAQWDKDVAEALASEIGITPLTEKHWQIIEFCRSDFAVQGDAPTLRRITKEANVPTKELYQLFPKGPAKKVAYIAGLKKPSGCI
jgi:tRNA 2-thiouridine synthesizing protein E